ncbi:hypothetical protein SLA2020_023500 [Shorea laevis]
MYTSISVKGKEHRRERLQQRRGTEESPPSTPTAKKASTSCYLVEQFQDIMSGTEDVKEQEQVAGNVAESEKSMPSAQEEEAAVKKKYGGIMPKKPPLISKDHERAYFDSADWALGKQGIEKPKGPLEALRPKLQPTQQQTRYRKSPYAPSEGEDGGSAQPEDATANE